MTDDLPQNGSATLAPSDRLTLIREAFRLEWLTIGWMTVEAAVSIAAGITANSLVLIAFGLDSVIELASAGVLMWRLLVELRHGQKFSERAERIASRTGGALLFLLAVYIMAAAVWRLWNGTGEEFSWTDVEIDIAVMTGPDVPEKDRLAEAVVWGLCESAGASDGAAAIVKPISRDVPAGNLSHVDLQAEESDSGSSHAP